MFVVYYPSLDAYLGTGRSQRTVPLKDARVFARACDAKNSEGMRLCGPNHPYTLREVKLELAE